MYGYLNQQMLKEALSEYKAVMSIDTPFHKKTLSADYTRDRVKEFVQQTSKSLEEVFESEQNTFKECRMFTYLLSAIVQSKCAQVSFRR